MIIIVQRSDMSRMYADLEADFVGLQHFGMSVATTRRAELIVFIDRSKVYVLKAEQWPYGKPMSASELLQYIANHTSKGVLLRYVNSGYILHASNCALHKCQYSHY